MPHPHPVALRTRAVAAYESGEGSYVAIAEQFAIEAAELTAVITDRPDATVEEIRRAYHRRVRRSARVSRSSIVRAMQRGGYVLKTNAAGRARSIDRTST